MTDKIADTLNLPRLAEALKAVEENEKQELALKKEEQLPETAEAMAKVLSDHEAIERALANSTVDLSQHDSEMDKIADEAIDNHRKLMDLGFNVDSNRAGSIFEPAVNMLRIVLDAKNSKIEKKLRLMRIQLEKERSEKNRNMDSDIIEADDNSIIADRNRLLERIREMDKKA